jgi:DNA-binding PadR family transcriptional regulator
MTMFQGHRAGRSRRSERDQWPPFGFQDFVDEMRSRRAVVRRGDVRSAILRVLRDKPMHGYQVIQELEAQSGGRWRPSAGSVYPTLQLLEDEGLVRSQDVDGRRTYSLTDAGTAAAERTEPVAAGRRNWRTDRTDLRALAIQLAGAAMQVNKMGSPEAKEKARLILLDSRRQLYGLLSEDEAALQDEDMTPPAGSEQSA